MQTQTSYPVFESGQVLTSKHLNDLVSYLEQQDRLTRNKLIGIGIVCGLEVGFEPDAGRVRLTRGCAITSEGYLLAPEEGLFDRFRTYTVPIPKVEEAPEEVIAEARYSFFFKSNGDQVLLWELLPVGHVPGPGEPAASPITGAFLQGKVALLFLERTLESLRNCDVGDCSDRGSEYQFTLRLLLVGEADAQAILAREAEIAGRPVHRHTHPGLDLTALRLPKINPARHKITTFLHLFGRIAEIAAQAVPQVMDSLNAGYKAYAHFLADMYPPAAFPAGPFGEPNYLLNVVHQVEGNVFLVQYLFDFLLDLAQSHNEFLAAAGRLDAECCPHPDRFPRHVLLGRVTQRPVAFDANLAPGTVAAYDPLKAETGFGPTPRPAAYRHHFIPSPALDRGGERLQEVRSLHYRTYLLALRYRTEGLLAREIRITPSREGDYRLSDKAVPFYYAFAAGDDLHRNWSFDRTIANRLAQVLSYQFVSNADHPLLYRMDDHNFYRVEGIIGKGLGQVMAELRRQKRELGLSFGFEPVFLGLAGEADQGAGQLDQEAQARAQAALLKLLMCRVRDLDIVFLLLMGLLFYYLYALLVILRRANTAAIAGIATVPPDRGTIVTPVTAAFKPRSEARSADALLRQLRGTTYQKGQLADALTTDLKPEQSITRLYAAIKAEAEPGRLYEQTRDFAARLAPGADADLLAQRIYPYVALADSAEELIETVSAPSLASFNFTAFAARYDAFVQTFDAFRAAAERQEPATAEQAAINRALLQNQGAIVAAGPQAAIANLVGELQKRLQNFMAELLLGPYAQRHPGMEHRAGVPVGGTLVLLYTHRDSLLRALDAHQEALAKGLAALRGKLAPGSGEPTLKPLDALLPQPPISKEPLDDFVVLADFCLPYLCCDTDCSDVELAATPPPLPPPEEPREGVVRGRIFALKEGGDLVESAAVSAVEAATGLPVKVDVDTGKYKFAAPPGKYRITVTADQAGMLPQVREVVVEPGSRQTQDFVLQPAGSGRVEGTVLGQFASGTQRPLKEAIVKAVSRETGKEVAVTFGGGKYSFEAPAGVYSILVSGRPQGFGDEQRDVTLTPGAVLIENFVLKPLG